MTVKAIYAGGAIRPEEIDKLGAFKKNLNDGDWVEMTFKKWKDTRSDRAFRYFHALMNRYSQALNINRVFAKHELCILYGEAVPYDEHFEPPEWPGHFVNYHGEIWFRKSTNTYKTDEMARLIEGTLMALNENGVDIEDLIIEHGDYYSDTRKKAV